MPRREPGLSTIGWLDLRSRRISIELVKLVNVIVNVPEVQPQTAREFSYRGHGRDQRTGPVVLREAVKKGEVVAGLYPI